MFFRREKSLTVTFDQTISNLKQFGFETHAESAGRVRVSRQSCAAMVESKNGSPAVGKAGVLIGNEIAQLVHGGYKMFLRRGLLNRFPSVSPGRSPPTSEWSCSTIRSSEEA